MSLAPLTLEVRFSPFYFYHPRGLVGVCATIAFSAGGIKKGTSRSAKEVAQDSLGEKEAGEDRTKLFSYTLWHR
ncbi:MAG: hypothetical protein HY912_19305 [Desulfomonile tiedjei]|uniref:Uncharacterized protein n=1 Tax=Desulfomonile tiedjei TaxID=2358 RepID=A0A9D6V3X9_9BACT|nr:hypothetical protein [Desulfomonile tiedjei]